MIRIRIDATIDRKEQITWAAGFWLTAKSVRALLATVENVYKNNFCVYCSILLKFTE